MVSQHLRARALDYRVSAYCTWRNVYPPGPGAERTSPPWLILNTTLCPVWRRALRHCTWYFWITPSDEEPDSSGDIVTRLHAGRARNRGSIPGSGKKNFISLKRPDWLWSPPNHLCNGYWGVGGAAAGARSWPHISLSSAEVNAWSHTSTPPLCPHGVHRDNYTATEHIQAVMNVWYGRRLHWGRWWNFHGSTPTTCLFTSSPFFPSSHSLHTNVGNDNQTMTMLLMIRWWWRWWRRRWRWLRW
jgi:hypothetical protein